MLPTGLYKNTYRETGGPWAEIDTTQNDYEEIGAFIIDHKQNVS